MEGQSSILLKPDGVRNCVCVKADAAGLKTGDVCLAAVAGRKRFCTVRAVLACAIPPTAGASFIRAATDDDLSRREMNNRLAQTAMRAFDTESAGAPQRPYAIEAHFDEPRKHLVLIFHADRPFDARRMEMSLGRRFGADVEARQVGIREEFAVLGSIGPCGCPVCCARVMRSPDAVGVNLRMAKRQNISLNPASLNGQCDRLKCCLGFEEGGDGA